MTNAKRLDEWYSKLLTSTKREVNVMKGSFIVASGIFATMTIVSVLIQDLSILGIGLMLGAGLVLNWSAPILKVYFSTDEERSTQ